MLIAGVLFRLIGGLSLFLFGMKMMSSGLQQSAGDRMRKALNFMTGNRFAGLITGFIVTAVIQSSSAVTVMIVSFVNAGLLTLTQSIGTILGANIGTTITAWIVSLLGFSISMTNLALPAVGIGFIMGIAKWKHKSLGDFVLGFGLLFLGLNYLTQGMGNINEVIDFNSIAAFRDRGLIALMISFAAGIVMTMLINSSSAGVAIIMTMAFNNIITFEMAASMVLGSNVGTTINAPLAAIGGSTAAKRAALAHVLFNILGAIWAVPMLMPLLNLVGIILPGDPWAVEFSAAGVQMSNYAIPIHLSGLHTVYKIINVSLFLPFVNQYSKLICKIIPEREEEKAENERHYRLEYRSRRLRNASQFNILRAEKEIQGMAALASEMFAKLSGTLGSMLEKPLNEDDVNSLTDTLKRDEEYADEMREEITNFLIECTREFLSPRSKARISRLLKITADLEDLTDDCYSASQILNQSITKKQVFKRKELAALIPYMALVTNFLDFLKGVNLGSTITREQSAWALELENQIDNLRDKLRKLGRKRLEAGKNVRTELLFIDLVRRIEKMGDYCFNITEELSLK